MRQIDECKEWLRKNYINVNLDLLLQEISVMPCSEIPAYQNDPILSEWYAVIDTQNIFALFLEEQEAFRCRLDYINRILN